MTPSSQAAYAMIQAQGRRYASDLSAWASRVRGQRTTLEAFRQAANPPQPGQLIRSLRHVWQSDKARAERSIETHLESLVAQIPGDDPQLPTLLRLAQGHWPKIARAIEARQRSAP